MVERVDCHPNSSEVIDRRAEFPITIAELCWFPPIRWSLPNEGLGFGKLKSSITDRSASVPQQNSSGTILKLTD